MLTNTATSYLVELCGKYTENKYIVAEWQDLKGLYTQEDGPIDVKELWKELKMNGCLINKYADDEEVCFTLTDKARVLVQEYKALIEQMAAQNEEGEQQPLAEGFIKTDETGSLVMMTSNKESAKKRRFEVRELKKSAMGRGFLGGLLSGGIMGLIFGALGGIIINLLT